MTQEGISFNKGEDSKPATPYISAPTPGNGQYPSAPAPVPAHQPYYQSAPQGQDDFLNRGPDNPVSSFHLILAWALTLFSGFYMLPWAIAATRGVKDSAAVGVITFLLGWTLIGWVWMLYKACTDAPYRG